MVDIGLPEVAWRELSPMEGERFDMLYALLLLPWMMGMFIDAGRHATGDVQSFLVLPHIIFYTSFFALAAILLYKLYRDKVILWQDSLFEGYWLSLIGMLLFALGSVADLFWHGLFGFRPVVDVLVQPAYLVLGAGALMIASGPLRFRMREGDMNSLFSLSAMVLSAAVTHAVLVFMTMYVHPVLVLFTEPVLVAVGLMMQAVMLAGVLLVVMQQLRLPLGMCTVVFGAAAVGVSLVLGRFVYVPAYVLAGLVTDGLYWRFDVAFDEPVRLRLFLFASMTVLAALFMDTVYLLYGMPWPAHRWLGVILLSGLAGMGVSIVAVRPSEDV